MIKYDVIEGKNPRTEAPVFFAQICETTPITLDQISAEVSENASTSLSDVRAVLRALQDKMIENLSNGMSVHLDDLGCFCPTLRSKSTGTPEAWRTDNIESIGIRFTESTTLKAFLSLNNPHVQVVKRKKKED